MTQQIFTTITSLDTYVPQTKQFMALPIQCICKDDIFKLHDFVFRATDSSQYHQYNNYWSIPSILLDREKFEYGI